MAPFGSLEEIEKVLHELSVRQDGPFVAELSRKPGHKEPRFVQLFSGASDSELKPDPESRTMENSQEQKPGLSRLDLLENEVISLRSDMEELKKLFQNFRKQFE